MNVKNSTPSTTPSLFPESFRSLQVELPNSTTSIYTLIHSPSKPLADVKVLVLLHGYPQNHSLWAPSIEYFAKSTPEILDSYIIIIPDLPGYGRSTKPEFTNATPSLDHRENSKKVVAGEIVALVDELIGKDKKFALIGHDRGARVSYKLAKDFPERITGLCVQDIVPTESMFSQMSLANGHKETLSSNHWIFLAVASPLPETLIGNDPNFYISYTINSWTGTKMKANKYDPILMNSWVSPYQDKAVILGALEDYRAGASIDLKDDAEDVVKNGGKVEMELLVLYSVHLGKRFDVGGIWENLAGRGLKVVKIGDDTTGHFLPVEAPEQVCQEIIEFLERL